MPTQILPAASLRSARSLPAARALLRVANYLICIALWSIGRGICRVASNFLPALREGCRYQAASSRVRITAGPGLRWAQMGPHLTFHLAGGVGGIDHFLDQFAAPMASWWESLGNPTLTPELRQQLTQGIAGEAAGRGIAELEARRDLFLVDLL